MATQRLDHVLRRIRARLTRVEAALGELPGLQADLIEARDRMLVALGESVRGMDDAHRIVVHVAKVQEVEPAQIFGPSKPERLALARRLAIALCMELTPHNTVRLGAFFNRTHGAIVHAITAHSNLVQTDARYATIYARLRLECEQAKAGRVSA